MFLAAAWGHNDLRIGQINWYFQSVVEKHLTSLGPGWEIFRRTTFNSKRNRAFRRQRDHSIAGEVHALSAAPSLIGVSARGMFLTTQVVALLTFIVRYGMDRLQHVSLEALIQELKPPIITGEQAGLIGVLFAVCVNVGIMTSTAYFLRHRRIRSGYAGESQPSTDATLSS